MNKLNNQEIDQNCANLQNVGVAADEVTLNPHSSKKYPKNWQDLVSDPKLERRIKTTPSRFQARLRAAIHGNLNRTAAVHLKCYDCVGYEDASRSIRECRVLACTLWHFRPHSEDSANV